MSQVSQNVRCHPQGWMPAPLWAQSWLCISPGAPPHRQHRVGLLCCVEGAAVADGSLPSVRMLEPSPGCRGTQVRVEGRRRLCGESHYCALPSVAGGKKKPRGRRRRVGTSVGTRNTPRSHRNAASREGGEPWEPTHPHSPLSPSWVSAFGGHLKNHRSTNSPPYVP